MLRAFIAFVVIVVEKSLTEETKKVSQSCPRETLWNDKNVVAIIFTRMNLIKNVGADLKQVSIFVFFERTAQFVCSLKVESSIWNRFSETFVNTASFDSCHWVNMEVCGSFKSVVGELCGFDTRDRKKEAQIIP